MQTPTPPPDSKTPWTPPDPSAETVRTLRKAAHLSQTEAGALVGGTLRTWQDWEAGKRGAPGALLSLFVIRTVALGLLPASHQYAASYLPPELVSRLKSSSATGAASPRRLATATGADTARRITARVARDPATA